MARFENTFSWSRSRDGMFKECRRKYWLSYYGSWGGWEPVANQETREAYLLKKTQTRWMWAGSAVHKSLEHVLKQTRQSHEPDMDQILADTVARMRVEFQQSRRGDIRKNTRAQALAEHEYRENVADSEWVSVRELVTLCLQNYWKTDIRQQLVTLPSSAWLSVEDMVTFDFEGTKIWVVPDLAFRSPDGTTVLVDWKTTRSDAAPDPIQLVTYAMYSVKYWQGHPDAISAQEVRLYSGVTHVVPVSQQTVVDVQDYIRESIKEMQSLLVDIPRNVAKREQFPKTDDDGKCKECVFRALCHNIPWRGI